MSESAMSGSVMNVVCFEREPYLYYALAILVLFVKLQINVK